jgi:hypothetical protein
MVGRLAWLAIALAACDGAGAPDASVPPDAPIEGWRVRATSAAEILAPRPEDGCLAPTGEALAAGEERRALSADDRFVLVGIDGACVRTADVEQIDRPARIDPAWRGVARLDVERSEYDASGCPASTGEALPFGTVVEALARSHDASYRGYVVVDRSLGLAPVRAIDVAGWIYPWHSSVQMLRPIPTGGFVIGGGVLIGPQVILTVRHLGVDGEWCYGREPASGTAWSQMEFVCGNVDRVVAASVDLAVVHLLRPEPPPWGRLRELPLQPEDAFYTANWSSFRRHAMRDATVEWVGSRNALCETWPDLSTFASYELVVGPGDSGGPAWAGDEIAGIVHGDRCRTALEPSQHVWIHVPGMLEFIRGELDATP